MLAACSGTQPPAETPAASPVEAPPAAPITSETAPPAAPETPSEPPPPAPVVSYTEGISTPESVLYDAASDRYLVSNINGGPLERDNNGFISELSPDGTITKLKLIAGGENKVKLDAPKGMGISQGVLYVTDIDVVRRFDLKTGASKGDLPIAGAAFLNDVTVAPDGRVFVSDSGWKLGEKGFEGVGTDAIYVIQKGKVTPLVKSTELGEPNGVLFTEKGLLAVTGGAKGEVYKLDDKGGKSDVTSVPGHQLDGLAAAGDQLLVSSWPAKTVYRGTLGGSFTPVVTGVNAPADIGFDSKRSRLLIPRFLDNKVEVYDLK